MTSLSLPFLAIKRNECKPVASSRSPPEKVTGKFWSLRAVAAEWWNAMTSWHSNLILKSLETSLSKVEQQWFDVHWFWLDSQSNSEWKFDEELQKVSLFSGLDRHCVLRHMMKLTDWCIAVYIPKVLGQIIFIHNQVDMSHSCSDDAE